MSKKRHVAAIAGQFDEGGRLTVKWSCDPENLNEQGRGLIESLLSHVIHAAQMKLGAPFARVSEVEWFEAPAVQVTEPSPRNLNFEQWADRFYGCRQNWETEPTSHIEALRAAFSAGALDAFPPRLADPDLAQRIVDLLNEMLLLDRRATSELCAIHVECNDALASHPSIQVGPLKEGSLLCHVGILGVLNGIVGTDADGLGIVSAVIEGDDWDKATEILSFKVLNRVLLSSPAKYPRQVLDDLCDAGEISNDQRERLMREV